MAYLTGKGTKQMREANMGKTIEEDHHRKIYDLMSAARTILLNMCDREEVYDDEGKPYGEFAGLYLAYVAMGGTLGLSDEEEVLEDCRNLK